MTSLIHFHLHKVAAAATEIRPSPIEGKGLFTTRDREPGDVISSLFMRKSTSPTGRTVYDQSRECRYTNHADNPNCVIVLDDDVVKLVACEHIAKGEELTADYNTCEPVLGSDFDFTYDGEPYNGGSDSVNKNQEKEAISLERAIDNARRMTDDPTHAQAAAGNYSKGKFRAHGLVFTIEVPKDGFRKGVGSDGQEWSRKVTADYGYINRTVGADGDAIDVYIGPEPETEIVFVVDQLKRDGSFDEHKVLVGYRTADAAKSAYLANYPANWTGLGGISGLTIPQFRTWLGEGNKKKPVAGMTVKAASSVYLDALKTTPVNYDASQGLTDNLLRHLGGVKQRGDQRIAESGAQERLQVAANPSQSSAQLLQFLQGRRHVPGSDPLDRFIAGAVV